MYWLLELALQGEFKPCLMLILPCFRKTEHLGVIHGLESLSDFFYEKLTGSWRPSGWHDSEFELDS